MNNEKIKILHIAHRLTGKADGVFKHLIMLFSLLDKQKFEQFLIYSDDLENVNSFISSLDIKVYPLPEFNKKLPLIALGKIYEIVKKQKIDIIHTHLVKPYLIAGLLNFSFKKKLIFNYHGAFIEETFYNSFEIKILKKLHSFIIKNNLVNMWIFPSKKLAQDIMNEYHLKINYKYYYNGYFNIDQSFFKNDSEWFDNLNKLKRENFLVGIIGRIDKWKRIDIALEVLKHLLDNALNIVFVFIGDGENIKEMKNYALKLGVDKNALFFDFIPYISNKLSVFDLILITSEKEGFPLVIWEAMYNSVPVVSSDIGGIREILINEKCGYVYPLYDIKTCVEIITELYLNREILINLGKNGRKALEEKYNSKNFKEFFEKLYFDLLNE